MNHQMQEAKNWIETGDACRDDDPVLADDELQDPIATMLERAAFDAALGKSTADDPDWDALLAPTSTLAKRAAEEREHPDGVEEERVGDQLWKHKYQGGRFVGSELHDPELDDVMYFDADGNEVERAA